MRSTRKQVIILACLIASGVFFWACQKEETGITGPVVAADPCKGRIIQVNASSAASSPCVNNGSIEITAIGSSGFTYSLDGGGFQSSNKFINLAPGDHIYMAKDITGCAQSASVNVGTVPPGVLFRALRNLIVTGCINCHRSPSPSGGKDFTNDCEILRNGALIKATSVDTTHYYMQQPKGHLNAIDKAIIVDWIAAGGKYTD